MPYGRGAAGSERRRHGLDRTSESRGTPGEQLERELFQQPAQHIRIEQIPLAFRLNPGALARAGAQQALAVSILTASRSTVRLAPNCLHSSASMGNGHGAAIGLA